MPKKQKEPRVLKASAVDEEKKDVKVPDYDDNEKKYINGLQKRLTTAQINRDATHGEFDGLTYLSYWWANERAANTTLKPKINRVDTQFQSGTLRTKMLGILSVYQGLNLKADISAYNENAIVINQIGNGMEDILDKCGELENDDELKMLRQYEMLKHGYVFVQDIWDERWTVNKKVTSGFFGNINGVKWTTTREKALGRPRKRIVPGPAVYLGSLKQYFITNQPYTFTVEVMDWSEAEQLFGGFERWEFVGTEKRKFSGNVGEEMAHNAWRFITDIQTDQVEVIRYEDKPNNEFQIILNGVPMLPAGYPLTEISPSGEYTLVQQNLEPIRNDYAYGKSFIFKNKNIVAILDEMMKLAVLKTQKSFMPARLNLTKRTVSKSIFMPGKMTTGILPNQVPVIDDKEAEGVTRGEMGMIQEIIKFNDRNTMSQTFMAQREGGGTPTATQILELQRQARIMMGLLTLAATLLEKKLITKRLGILLKSWFQPLDKVVDKARNVLKNRYRRAAVSRHIEGEGAGIRMVVPMDELPTPQQIKNTEVKLKKETGMPIKVIALNANEIQSVPLTWVVNVTAKEKRSSEMSKILFGTEMTQAIELGLRLNLDHVEDRFAQVWEEDSSKLFGRGGVPVPPGAPGAGGEAPKVSPQLKVPAREGIGATIPR